jgi:hypothetical protein
MVFSVMTSEFAWSEGRTDVDKFSYTHDAYDLELVGERTTNDKGAEFWEVQLFTATGQHLFEVVGMRRSREKAETAALQWAQKHERLAGFRVNDGYDVDDNPVEHKRWTEPVREEAVEDIREWGFGEDAVFFSPEMDAYLRVTELTPEGFVAVPIDEVKARNIGVYSTFPARAAENIENEVFHKLNQEAVAHPLPTLLAFAEQQLQHRAEAGILSEHDGVQGVDRLCDVKAAYDLGKRNLHR